MGCPLCPVRQSGLWSHLLPWMSLTVPKQSCFISKPQGPHLHSDQPVPSYCSSSPRLLTTPSSQGQKGPCGCQPSSCPSLSCHGNSTSHHTLAVLLTQHRKDFLLHRAIISFYSTFRRPLTLCCRCPRQGNIAGIQEAAFSSQG